MVTGMYLHSVNVSIDLHGTDHRSFRCLATRGTCTAVRLVAPARACRANPYHSGVRLASSCLVAPSYCGIRWC